MIFSMRGFLIRATLCLIFGASAAAGVVHAQPSLQFSLVAQPLADALRAVATQASLNVVFDPPLVADRMAPALQAQLTTSEVLSKLLAGTGLEFEFVSERTVAIRPAATDNVKADSVDRTGFHLARSEGEEGAGAAESKPANAGDISEIIVTAQKRPERLQDVPVPVAVLNTATLTENNQTRLQDYYLKVPGLGLALIGDGSAPTVTIRGITTGGVTNPAVGIVVDDVPYGGSVTPGFSPTVPDIDPGDLARVEVLRGPQGTLYGASSIGGLLKFVTIDPSTEAVRGRLQAGFASVENGEVGHTLRGSINVPLSDEFAVRASAFAVRDPGYVDNIQTGHRDVNRRDSGGGHVSALWKPSDVFSLKLNALVQDSKRRGIADVDVALGSGLQQTGIPGTGIYNRKSQAYGATMTARLGSVDLVSVTGYNIDETASALDASAFYGTAGTGSALLNFGVTGVAGGASRDVKKLTQEVRLSVPVGERIHWLFGAFYANEDVDSGNLYLAENPLTGTTLGAIYTAKIPSAFDEYAAFTHLTFDITERFDVQVGGRLSENKQTFAAVRTGPLARQFFNSDPSEVTEKISKDSNVFTYLVTPRLRVSPDFMVYARFASGYRPGGPNTGCGIPTVPCQFDPDKAKNYEVGAKGSAFDGRLAFDASLYYIDWENIQLSLTIGGFGYQTNASRAKSQGVELSVESKPLAGLTLSAWAAYNDAKLTENFPATATNVRGLVGDRLPYSSRVSGSVSVDREFPLGSSITGFAGGSVSYVGDRKGVFRSALQTRETFPAYTQLDLRMGARYGTWTANAFVNNLTDKRGILRSGLDSLRPTFLSYIQPRTVGLAVSKDF